MLFLLPLIAVGLIALAGRYTAPAPAPAHVSAAAPSPFVVLDGFVRAGRTPPPFVVQCAIAEAEIAGRMDLVTELVRMFVEPIVREAEQAISARPVIQHRFDPALPGAHTEHASASSAPTLDDDVHAALMAMEHPQIDAQIDAQIVQPFAPPPPRAESPAVSVSGALPQMAHMEDPPDDGDPANLFTPARSPIPNLPPEQFGRFAGAISREAPTFDGPRHTGQFRARKDRLVELGIDPSMLRGDHEAQVDALCVDMADAFAHAKESGMLRQHCRRAIDLGAKHGGVHTITASGIMAVIQAAGLEGAADWLENPADRDRFPHTTAMFVRGNGVF